MFGLKTTPRRVERECFGFRLDDGREVEVEQVRDPRARRLRLSVSEGRVRLVLPHRGSVREARRFLEAHGGWLAIQLARQAASAGPRPGPLVPGETTHLPLRGESLPLVWAEGRFTRVGLDAHGVAIQVGARAGPQAVARALRDFYEAQARTDVGRWLPPHLPGLPRPPRAIRFKQVRSIWGSLSPAGDLSLDLSLVLARPAAFEYVLVHELCHLIEHNHSRRFWREVERRFPAWRAERDWLMGEGAGVKGRLAGLLGAGKG